MSVIRHEDDAIDVGGSPDLLGLAEEVRATGRARLLRHDGEPLAMVVPYPMSGRRRLKPRSLSAEDIAAFRSSAGSWADVDVESFLRDVYAARDVPDDRPPVRL